MDFTGKIFILWVKRMGLTIKGNVNKSHLNKHLNKYLYQHDCGVMVRELVSHDLEKDSILSRFVVCCS